MNIVLNKQDMDRLRMVADTADNFEKLTFNALYNKLDSRYKNRGTLSVICYSLKKLFVKMNSKKKSEMWGKKGLELAQEVNTQERKSELTGNEVENWKTQEEILKLMNEIPLKTRTNYNRFLLLAQQWYRQVLAPVQLHFQHQAYVQCFEKGKPLELFLCRNNQFLLL